MKLTNHRKTTGSYHDLLDLHHSLLLRRSMRGETSILRGDGRAGDPAARLAAWTERLDDQRLLRESLPLVEPLPDTLTHLYTALFRDNPHLRSLFPGSITAQRERLTWSFRQLIDGLDEPDRLITLFGELGRAHRKLGVRTPHYQPFGAAFLEALRLRAGAAWCTAYDDAWHRAYQFLADVMSDAANRAIASPPYVTGTVVEHERRRPDLAILRVRTAAPYEYRAGQYATIASEHLPHTWRSYSMATAPNADALLEFHVRATGADQLSDVLVHRTTVGDRLRLGPVRGTMTIAPQPVRGVLLAAGGTGLAPILALLGALTQVPEPPETWLIFGARTREDLYWQTELQSYADRFPWLHPVLTVSDEIAYPHEFGTVVDAVIRHGDRWRGYDAYLAGPARMVTALAAYLLELGVAPDRIQHDPL